MFYIGLLLFYGIGFILVAFPAPIVRWQARMYARHYPQKEERELLDRLQWFNPLSRLIYGKMSDFIDTAPDHPEAFPRAIWFVRLLGLIPLIGGTVILIYFTAVI